MIGRINLHWIISLFIYPQIIYLIKKKSEANIGQPPQKSENSQ